MNKKPHIIPHEWKIIEDRFDPALMRASESIFSLGNGYMGQRANFEENYSGDSLQGTYIGGIYYPDKTRVGWWKVGYPEYFAKVPNAPYWNGIAVNVNGVEVDLNRLKILEFRRELDMKRDVLTRHFKVELPGGKILSVKSERFISMKRKEQAVIKYGITPENFKANLQITPYIDGNIHNEDANYGERFWQILQTSVLNKNQAGLLAQTKKSHFRVAVFMHNQLLINKKPIHVNPDVFQTGHKVELSYSVSLNPGENFSLIKYVSVVHDMNHPREQLTDMALEKLQDAVNTGYEKLLREHSEEWRKIWETSDIEIEGDTAAQQGIRFNILQLNHTYTGHDPRLNIGPKGFTGEKYGGGTYWDTEAFCIPFYLATKNKNVARNLLLYRYRHLPKAIENAGKLGFSNGAALYPMVTMNGEESHNEWEITFEEIHRNGAIVYAIYNYVQYTGDYDYIKDYGMEVMIAVSRFWSQRVNWSEKKGRFVILGVTGPNEYENNVNNNWYTNYIARWTLQFTLENLEKIRENFPDDFKRIIKKTNLKTEETRHWKKIIKNLYLPEDQQRRIFLQQDGFLDKEIRPAYTLNPAERPLNQHWSWDRILRSCFIKQADVLQGLYFFENHFDKETLHKNFTFYEPLTVHESSLSPCIHSVLAASTGNESKAYEMYLRTARLDLDDYNHEVHEGLHITSMAGTWLSIVQGFGGMRTYNGYLQFKPFIPKQWKSYGFKINYRDRILQIKVNKDKVKIRNLAGEKLQLYLYDEALILDKKGMIERPVKSETFNSNMN